MLNVLTLEEAISLVKERFSPVTRTETVPLSEAKGRTLAEDVCAVAYVPDFDRSSVDGYAVHARDTFGCTDAIPAILTLQREIYMGQGADFTLSSGCCAAIPTGGAVPAGADSIVMVEYTEDYGDGTVGVLKPVAPGQNMVFRGDDVKPGKVILQRGHVLDAQDIGALSALGKTRVAVQAPLSIAVLSTGDELVPPECDPGPGQVRDVNSPLIEAMLRDAGMQIVRFGIVRDDEATLKETLTAALQTCDAVVLSGGSSVGVKDAASRVIGSFGPLLFHGLAMKPGKPTILGCRGNQPIVGLPGHPVAAFFVTELFLRPLLDVLSGRTTVSYPITATLSESVSANHGRALYCACRVRRENGALLAEPIRAKSGLITSLTDADGYFCIERDCEGLPQGASVPVFLLTGG